MYFTFKEHDRKYKHKNNAHKYKGWKERGYKIITETEFVDRGRKVDQAFKKHVNGSKEHIKEHSAGDITKADQRKYHKNVKNLNKNYEALYGKRNGEKQVGTHAHNQDNHKDMLSMFEAMIIQLNRHKPNYFDLLSVFIPRLLFLKIDSLLSKNYCYFWSTSV